MPRADNYYDNQLDKTTAPVQQSSSDNQNYQDQSASDVSQTQRQQSVKITSSQLQADADYWKNEANRSIWSRLPFEFLNSVYDMPEEQDWKNNYSFLQKYWYLTKQSAKSTATMIKNLPREVLKVPLNLEQTAYDTAVSLAASGGASREQIMSSMGRGESYTLPWLGEVKGFSGTYHDAENMGAGKFLSAVISGGKVAGDVAMGLAAADAASSAFRPRVSSATESVLGKDFRPLTSKQVAETKAYTSQGKIINGEVLSAEQNPNVNYVKLPKSSTSQFKGNPNNTFLKITPKGEGMAEYSVVQIRKSFADSAVDFLKSKFGKSNVTAGPWGPELQLTSGTVKYNPYGLVKRGETDMMNPETSLDFNGVNIPKISSPFYSEANPVSKVAEVSTPAVVSNAYQFYSPNVQEAMTFEEAIKQMSSSSQASYRSIGQDIDQQLGLKSQAVDAIGDWSDGAENTVFNTIENVPDFNTLKYSTALKGKIGNQKSVIPFLAEEGGADSLYMADIKGASMEDIRPELDNLGINFRTLIKTDDGVKVVVFDQGNQLTNQINNLGEKYDTTIEQIQGKGEFLGSEGTRAEGLSEYNKIISEYESSQPDSQHYQQPQGTRVPNTVSQKISEIDPFAKEKPEVLSLMAKPLKGFGDKMVTDKQVGQIIDLKNDRELSDMTLQAVSRVITGKDNIYNLTQNEAYDVSEAIRLMPQEGTVMNDDFHKINRSWTHPARYWMEAAERELHIPVYSEVFLPIETGARLLKVYSERWQETARDAFGKYSDVKFVEERRLITDYLEGNKNAILKNDAISPEVAQDLVKIAEWLKSQYKLLFKDLGITSERFFEVYSPKIRKIGGISNLYKSDELPVEIKPFYRFEREGDLSPLEDDALALFDIYTRAIGKETYLREPIENARSVIERAPVNVGKAANDYLQEKIGFQDSVDEMLNNFSKKLSEKTRGLIPENIYKQVYDFGMTTSYAGALGLPRIMPIIRNSTQVLLTTYPEVGAEFFAQGVRDFAKPGALQEIKDKGFLVNMGVPYGADLATDTGKGFVGKSLDRYKDLNRATMSPYGVADVNNRGITYYAVKARFEKYWGQFLDGKISYQEFEKGINMDGFNPTLQNVIRQKLQQNTDKSLEEALDLQIMDILDRTQFPYRKGSESRLHYGMKGKIGLQFAQWSWEYAFTLKSWISRGQWDKLIRWIGMSTAMKRTAEDVFGVDISKWIAFGPFSGFPLGPIGKMAASAIAGLNASLTGMTDEVNQHWQEIYRSMQIYGGVLTGVGAQKLGDFKQSVKRYEAGMAVSPYPDQPFGIWSSTGKIVRWVDFAELLKIMMGFSTPEGTEQSERINRIKKEDAEYSNHMNEAMNHLVDGDFDKFDKTVQKYNLTISDIAAKMKSYQTPLDQRIFNTMPLSLKIKYFNAFYPTE